MNTSFLFFFLFFLLATGIPHAVIHIGPGKTGTTTIQATLAANVAQARKDGVRVYPDHFNNHRRFPEWLMGEPKASAFNLTDKSVNRIFSSEKLFKLDIDAIERLKRELEGYNVTIVVFFRNPLDWLRSMWSQQACHKEYSPISLPRYLNERTLVLSEEGDFFFSPIDRYIEVFGKENIVVIDFDGAVERRIKLPAILGKIAETRSLDRSASPKNQRRGYLTPLNIFQEVYEENPSFAQCNNLLPGPKFRKITQHLETNGFLEDCEEAIDMKTMNLELQNIFEMKFKKRDLKVMYGWAEEPGKRRELQKLDCRVVKKGGKEFFWKSSKNNNN